MSFSPEGNASNVPKNDEEDFDSKWGTGGLSLEGGEAAPAETPIAEAAPGPSLEELGKQFNVNKRVEAAEPVVAEVEVTGEASSSELFALAETAADRERTEQLSKVENFGDLFDLFASWGYRIPHPEGGTINLNNTMNSIRKYLSGEKKISKATLDRSGSLFPDMTRTNGIREKVQSLFNKQAFVYTGADGVKRSMVEEDL